MTYKSIHTDKPTGKLSQCQLKIRSMDTCGLMSISLYSRGQQPLFTSGLYVKCVNLCWPTGHSGSDAEPPMQGAINGSHGAFFT